eukprot:8700718-Ditylum_brightwellii.AAC.1
MSRWHGPSMDLILAINYFFIIYHFWSASDHEKQLMLLPGSILDKWKPVVHQVQQVPILLQ